MSTFAIIIAGGSGQRMGQNIPKQFINVYDKPVIIYTLEAFQRYPSIDEIYCVCIDGWQDILRAYSKQFNITKLKDIFTGGATTQESIRNGVFGIKNAKENDIIVIHDGVRPLVDDFVLSDVIIKCQECGNAVSSMPYNEQIFVKDSEKTIKDVLGDVKVTEFTRFQLGEGIEKKQDDFAAEVAAQLK